MRGKTVFDWLGVLIVFVVAIDVLLRWHDRALSQRMRDVAADDAAAGAGGIGTADVPLEDVIARRRRT